MGRQFAGICGARGSLYGCVVCNTYLTCSKELTSKAFTGSTGPATLFKRAWNVVYGRCEHRKMTTGWHTVRDVFCVTCNQKLGWMYEMAVSESQTYKETQVIIENANFEKIAGAIKDPLGEDRQEAPPAPNLEMSRYPLEAEKKSRPQYRTVSVSSSSSSEC